MALQALALAEQQPPQLLIIFGDSNDRRMVGTFCASAPTGHHTVNITSADINYPAWHGGAWGFGVEGVPTYCDVSPTLRVVSLFQFGLSQEWWHFSFVQSLASSHVPAVGAHTAVTPLTDAPTIARLLLPALLRKLPPVRTGEQRQVNVVTHSTMWDLVPASFLLKTRCASIAAFYATPKHLSNEEPFSWL